MWRVLRPSGRLAIVVVGPLHDATAYLALIDLVRRHVGDAGARSISSRFVLGNTADLKQIMLSEGVLDFTIKTYWGYERFPSRVGFAEAEIRASNTLIGLFDGSSLPALLREAELAPGIPVSDNGRVEFRSSGHVVTAIKAYHHQHNHSGISTNS